MTTYEPHVPIFRQIEPASADETAKIAHLLRSATVPWEQPQYIKMLAESRKVQAQKDSKTS